MNKWRLLLLSIFALLHVTTSEKNFIHGKIGCCDRTQRHSLRDSRLPVYDSYRDHRYLLEIRQLNGQEKNPTGEETNDSRRSYIEYQKQRSLANRVLDEKNRRIVARPQTRILSTISEVIRGRQISRERKNEGIIEKRTTSLRHERLAARQLDRQYRREAPVTIMTRKYNQQNIEITKLFDIKNVRQIENNRRDVYGVTQDDRILKKRNIDIAFSTVSRAEPSLRNTRAISTRINELKTRRFVNTEPVLRSYEREDYRHEKELSRPAIRSSFRSEDRNPKDNNGRNGQIFRQTMQRNADDFYLNERERISRIDSRAKNFVRIITRNSESEALRQTSRRQRSYNENRLERDTRVNNDNLRRLDKKLEITRTDRQQTGPIREIRGDDRTQFNRRNIPERIETRVQKRSLSEDILRNKDIDFESRRNIDNVREMERIERIITLVPRLSYNRFSERKDVREIIDSRVIQRDNSERTTVRDNKVRGIRCKLPVDENRERSVIRLSSDNQRTINQAMIRMMRHNREGVTGSYENRVRKILSETRDVNINQMHGNRQLARVNVRRNTHTDRIHNDNKQERFEGESRLRVRQNQDMILRSRKSVVTELRDVKKKRNSESRLSRRSTNEDRLTNRRQTRNSRDERRNTKNTNERRINILPVTLQSSERRISRQFENNQRSIRVQKVKIQTDEYELKWQYLFYLVQVVYLCSLLVKIPKENQETKNKMRITTWFTPAEYLKID